eukprot:TRINITY_DN91074_c0_g1_i1.p1 TRINITY_DN91074_c0_g1~~TRINITY_DN91074_c0_g1_i1.p1  ORF type:complete len:124 (+),score=24.58 TRINITY_DN91074_c0_g1_i1:127-498(+)
MEKDLQANDLLHESSSAGGSIHEQLDRAAGSEQVLSPSSACCQRDEVLLPASCLIESIRARESARQAAVYAAASALEASLTSFWDVQLLFRETVQEHVEPVRFPPPPPAGVDLGAWSSPTSST